MSAVVQPKGSDATAIRPFEMKPFPETELADLRKRINATRWPERETVADASQGVQLATTQKLARYWATEYDWRKVRGEAERRAAVHHRDRRTGHSFHPRPFKTRKCVAADRYARLARLGRRAAEDRRSTHRSHCAWRERIGCIPSGDSVDSRLRVFRQADHDRLGARPDRARLDHADAAPRLQALCRAGWRLGRCRHRSAGRAGAAGTARHSHQHARHFSSRD